MSKPGQFSIFCLVDSARSNNCRVCLISLDSVQFLYMLSKVRPAVSNKVSIIKCRRPLAKCWQSRAEQLFEIEEVSQTFLLYHKFMEITQNKLSFCVSQIVVFTVFCWISNKLLAYALCRTIVGRKKYGSRQLIFSAALSRRASWCFGFRQNWYFIYCNFLDLL